MEEPEDAAEEPIEDAEASSVEDDAPRPKKKKKKKRKKTAATGEKSRPARREAKGKTRSSSRQKPEDEEEAPPPPLPGAGTTEGDLLREAHRLFEVGDYKRVREHCKKLESDAEDAAVVDAARNLRRRVEIDPIQVVVVGWCAAALFAILYTWVL